MNLLKGEDKMKYILDGLGQILIAMVLLKFIIYLIPKPVVSIFKFLITAIRQFIFIIFNKSNKNTKRNTTKTSKVINLRTKKKVYNK